jgi:predicted transport protein
MPKEIKYSQCQNCSNQFIVNREGQKYCDDYCRTKYSNDKKKRNKAQQQEQFKIKELTNKMEAKITREIIIYKVEQPYIDNKGKQCLASLNVSVNYSQKSFSVKGVRDSFVFNNSQDVEMCLAVAEGIKTCIKIAQQELRDNE